MKRACPDEEMLAAYIEGLLPDHKRARMEMHLSECDTCLDEFKLTNSILRGRGRFEPDMVPSNVTDSAVRLVSSQNSISNDSLEEKIWRVAKDLYSNLLHHLQVSSLGKAQLVPIRSSKIVVSEDLVQVKKTFREFDTEIEIEKTGENRAHIRVRLFERDARDGIRVTLKGGEREVFSSLSSGGYVLFEDVSFGPYRLTFERDGVSLGAYLFNIKETRNGKK